MWVWMGRHHNSFGIFLSFFFFFPNVAKLARENIISFLKQWFYKIHCKIRFGEFYIKKCLHYIWRYHKLLFSFGVFPFSLRRHDRQATWARGRTSSRWGCTRPGRPRILQLSCPFKEIMLQSIIRSDSGFWIVVQHSQYEVLELEIIWDGVTRFSQSSPTGSTGFYPDDIMHLSRTGRLVFLSVFGNVEHIRAVGQFMEVFLRLGSLKRY